MNFHSWNFYWSFSDFARTRFQDVKTVLNGDNLFSYIQDTVNCHTEDTWLEKRKKSDLTIFC